MRVIEFSRFQFFSWAAYVVPGFSSCESDIMLGHFMFWSVLGIPLNLCTTSIGSLVIVVTIFWELAALFRRRQYWFHCLALVYHGFPSFVFGHTVVVHLVGNPVWHFFLQDPCLFSSLKWSILLLIVVISLNMLESWFSRHSNFYVSLLGLLIVLIQTSIHLAEMKSLYFHQILSPYHGCSYCCGLMDYVCLFYYLPWVYFSLQFIKARVDQQEYINSTIIAADFKGSPTVVHDGNPAEIVNKKQ